MKKAVGIIAEYNPFHNGHKYHLERSLELSGAEISVAAMSGNFTERGEMAILSKWKRAEIAVLNGIDLVVEIPTVFVTANAGCFAKAGVEILENLGCSNISFGYESNKEDIELVSRLLKENSEQIEEKIRLLVKEGLSYPKARGKVISEFAGKDLNGPISLPNNILAIEYLRNIHTSKPVMIERKGSDYNDNIIVNNTASASKVRNMMLDGDVVDSVVPKPTATSIINERYATREDFFRIFVDKIASISNDDLNTTFGSEEGLGNIIKRDFRKWKSYIDIIDSLKSKRYTETRINRVLVNLLLGITREDVINSKNYIRVLAFNEKGANYLKQVKKEGHCSLPILTNINKEAPTDALLKNTLTFDIKASDIFNLATEKDLYKESDYVKMPIKVDSLP